uniref:Uncharacterized protein n=1 Tax=Picea glauca TaxID=3330 RepID=A0A101LZP1_PICGL|nr:hypothetical protein ABT39_MTgene5334 [Picea glauca]QHR88912.1 hypothetical protein Q903MT_gene2931 [Picea sitchensis]
MNRILQLQLRKLTRLIQILLESPQGKVYSPGKHSPGSSPGKKVDFPTQSLSEPTERCSLSQFAPALDKTRLECL